LWDRSTLTNSSLMATAYQIIAYGICMENHRFDSMFIKNKSRHLQIYTHRLESTCNQKWKTQI